MNSKVKVRVVDGSKCGWTAAAANRGGGPGGQMISVGSRRGEGLEDKTLTNQEERMASRLAVGSGAKSLVQFPQKALRDTARRRVSVPIPRRCSPDVTERGRRVEERGALCVWKGAGL